MDKRVFIVDDDESVRNILKEEFENEGYEVVLAKSGEEALVVLEKQDLQIMFLDLKLTGIDGLTLCRKIRRLNPVACIFAMTAYTSLFDLAESRDAGFDDFFVKPVDMDVFIEAANNAYHKIRRWKNKNEDYNGNVYAS